MFAASSEGAGSSRGLSLPLCRACWPVRRPAWDSTPGLTKDLAHGLGERLERGATMLIRNLVTRSILPIYNGLLS